MDPGIDQAAFAALARRSGIPLTDADIAVLYEGYGWLQSLIADLGIPRDSTVEPALTFTPVSSL